MNFEPPKRIQTLLSDIRRFVERELYPLELTFFTDGFAAVEDALAQKRQDVKARGWWLPQIATELGGMGLSLVEHALIAAELGRSPLAHYAFNCQSPDSGNMVLLLERATSSQKERFLKPLLEGEVRSCFAVTEPERAGSNPTWQGTTAVRNGDDYVLNGHKWFITGADGAAFAIVMATTNPDGALHERSSMFIVPTDTPGFILEENVFTMGRQGEGWASNGELRFRDCRIPKANLLGGEGEGYAIWQERLGPSRIHQCMRWIGVCERSYDLMCDFALKREVGPGEPLADKQFVQGWIAESRGEIDAARLLVLDTAWQTEKSNAIETRDRIGLIKFHVAQTLGRVIDRAVQIHGALGLTDWTPLAYFYRTERGARLYDGTDEVHKLNAARRLLRRYRESASGGA